MIQQSMKMYEEGYSYTAPTTTKPATTQTTPTTTSPKQYQAYCTPHEIAKAHKQREMKKIWIGNTYKIQGTALTIKIKGFNHDPAKMEILNGEPAIIRGERHAPVLRETLEFNYTVEEIAEMELVNV